MWMANTLLFEEYKTLVGENQKDKTAIWFICTPTMPTNITATFNMPKIKATMLLIMDGQLDVHVVSQLEQKFEKRFVRVDSDNWQNYSERQSG